MHQSAGAAVADPWSDPNFDVDFIPVPAQALSYHCFLSEALWNNVSANGPFLIKGPQLTCYFLCLNPGPEQTVLGSQRTSMGNEADLHSHTAVVPVRYAARLIVFLNACQPTRGTLSHVLVAGSPRAPKESLKRSGFRVHRWWWNRHTMVVAPRSWLRHFSTWGHGKLEGSKGRVWLAR